MKIRLLSLFLLISIGVQGQIFLNGIVQDSLGNPIGNAALIHQLDIETSGDSTLLMRGDSFMYRPPYYFARTDWLGAFHLLVDTTLVLEFEITAYGFFPLKIRLDVLPDEPLIIQLKEQSRPGFHPYHRRGKRRPSEVGMGIDFLEKDFEDFRTLLGDNNVEQLGNLPLSITFDFAKNFGRFYTGVTWGISFNNRNFDDTLDIEINQTIYAFQLGYKIVDAKKILIMPQITPKLHRLRLINSYKGDDLPLPTYLGRQDLDLRFRQSILDLGLTIAYRHKPKKAVPNTFVYYGIQGGYPMRLRKNPRMNGLRSELDTDRSIRIGDFSLGIFMRAYFMP